MQNQTENQTKYYRVICTEDTNQERIVDICSAYSTLHDWLFSSRKKINPDVMMVCGGIILQDKGDGDISLVYEKHYNKRLKLYQENLRKTLDGQILDTYKKMKAKGLESTIGVDLTEVLNEKPQIKTPDVFRSAREEELFLACQREQKIKRLREAKAQYYATLDSASCPHLRLKEKMLMYRGD